ncbi:MAG: UDP-N-acetylmuramoyl-L-alanine--D-glutamate ligase [Thioalkalivibrio sp.]|nr:UDP-N-acetylmuramoyl-L-alanine--D-glutamate ligase [Thioalkalivibrio sp.]
MSETAAITKPDTLVVGLGATGLSVARHLAGRGEAFAITDTRDAPAGLARLAEIPGAESRWAGPLAALDPGVWRRIVISPGVPVALPELERAAAAGAEIVGDIELFARSVRQPVLGITGSNGKSTVTALSGALLEAQGRRVAVGGNFGTPALDLLDEDAELYVLELSSFQLETTRSLAPAGAAILNISADHLDRYADLEAYAAAKARILRGAQRIVVNRQDPVVAGLAAGRGAVTFGLDEPAGPEDFGILELGGQTWLARGATSLFPTAGLFVHGRHNWLNALAALALCWPWLEDPARWQPALGGFVGLPYRSRPVARHRDVDYVDDSKGTNVGATLAAIRGVAGPLILIAGGQGKGQDFAPLADALVGKARGVVLLGADAPAIAQALNGSVPVRIVDSMEEAVAGAAQWAQAGDTVLLSPACASLDMFANYAERGDRFAAAVRGLGT